MVRPVSLFNEIEIRLVRISKCRGAHVCLSNNRKDTSPFCLPVCPHVKFVNIQLRGKELGVYEFLHFLRVRQDETSESILLSPCHQCARERFLSTVIYTRWSSRKSRIFLSKSTRGAARQSFKFLASFSFSFALFSSPPLVFVARTAGSWRTRT